MQIYGLHLDNHCSVSTIFQVIRRNIVRIRKVGWRKMLYKGVHLQDNVQYFALHRILFILLDYNWISKVRNSKI